MDQNISHDLHAESIEASLVYSVDTGVKPVNETMEAGNLNRVYTGEFEDHVMTIRNGRAVEETFTLDEHGFEFIDHQTKVENFFDIDAIEKAINTNKEALRLS